MVQLVNPIDTYRESDQNGSFPLPVISMTISSTTNQADEGMHLGVLEK
jgi:hypothetical protein